MISWILFIILGLLQVYDIYTTTRILSANGKELNPIMKFLMDKFGVKKALVGSKVVILAVIGYLVVTIGGIPLTIGLSMLILVYVYVLYKNTKVMLGQIMP